MILTTGVACAILVGCFLVLVILRVPVAFALGLATIPVVMLDLRLTSFLIMDRMFQSYTRSFCWRFRSSYWRRT